MWMSFTTSGVKIGLRPRTERRSGWLFPAVPSSCSDRKSTRLNSSHANISYAVFCLKKKKSTSLNICVRLWCGVAMPCTLCFFFNDTATTEIYTLSLHDALPIYREAAHAVAAELGLHVDVVHDLRGEDRAAAEDGAALGLALPGRPVELLRSEEHTSELQSRQYLVCRLLLEKKKKHKPEHMCKIMVRRGDAMYFVFFF